MSKVKHFDPKKGFDFNLIKVENSYINPVTGIMEPTGLQSIVNNQNGKHIATKSKKYELFDNNQFMDFCETIAEKLGTTISHYTSISDGATVICGINKPTIEIAGFKTDSYLSIIDNRQGRKPLQIRTVHRMNRCENMLSAGSTSNKLPHNPTLPNMINWFLSLFEQVEKEEQKQIERYNMYASIKVDASIIEKAREYIFEVSKQEMTTTFKNKMLSFDESVTHEKIFENTLYWPLAAVTHYTSKNVDDRRTHPIMGINEKLNLRALKFCEMHA
jgi:hypothetical protein